MWKYTSTVRYNTMTWTLLKKNRRHEHASNENIMLAKCMPEKMSNYHNNLEYDNYGHKLTVHCSTMATKDTLKHATIIFTFFCNEIINIQHISAISWLSHISVILDEWVKTSAPPILTQWPAEKHKNELSYLGLHTHTTCFAGPLWVTEISKHSNGYIGAVN